MANRIRKRKCKNCHTLFPPDPRNAWHQLYCRKPECRKASKAASQQRWLLKEENRDHFRGPANVQRVQEWRSKHPGYWRRKPSSRGEPLQDLLIEKPLQNTEVEDSFGEAPQDLSFEKSQSSPSVEPKLACQAQGPLQDLLAEQHAVIIGLIAQMIGSPLQDHIVLTARRLRQLGADILNSSTQSKGERHDPKASHLCTPHPKGPEPVQLGGSPAGA